MVAFADFSHHQRDQAVSANSVQDWPPTKGEWSIMMQTGCQNAVFWILILWGLISTCSKELISVAKKKPSVRLHHLRQLKKGPELLFNPDEFNLSCSGRLFKCCFLYNAGFCCIIYCTLASGSKVQKKKKGKSRKRSCKQDDCQIIRLDRQCDIPYNKQGISCQTFTMLWYKKKGEIVFFSYFLKGNKRSKGGGDWQMSCQIKSYA